MTAPNVIDHGIFADALEASVLDGPGDTPTSLRQAAAARAAGSDAIAAPFDLLARQIGEGPARVTEAQVAALVRHVGERAAFEVIVAAAAGAGLHRWRRGLAVLKAAEQGGEASDASA